jgi:octaprenyl-diphosphate synthase
MDPLIRPIAAELSRFEQRLDTALQANVALVHEISRYIATLRGKRLRPVLALLSGQAVGGCNERTIEAAVAVELIHGATVVHDDVVDSATMRRGRASVNSAWTGQLAVLMGDFLLARALSILVDLGDLRALRVISRATERLSVGEIFEIQIGQDGDTRLESYFAMVDDKTASLIAAAARLGAILSGGTDAQVEALGEYGENVGRAFQIADDILDFTSDAGTLGKPVGHDLEEGRITLPLIHALDQAPAAERRALEALLRCDHRTPADGAAIAAFVARHQGVDAARATARECAARASQSLAVLPPSRARDSLVAAVNLVVERRY